MFSGGGARGAYQIGVFEALHRTGFRPDIVSGTSVGAILATLVACGCTPDRMKEIWRKACRPDFMPFRKDVHRIHKWDHLRRNERLRDLLEAEIDWDAVRDSPIELRFTAVDVCDAERVLFDNATASPDAVLASTSIPLIFEPEEVDGRPLWDGGVLTSTPLQPAIEEGATEVYAILNDPIGRTVHEPPSNLAEGLDRLIDIVNERALRRDLERAQEINQLVREGQAADYWHLIHFHVIGPQEPFDVDVLEFREDEAEEMWTIGYRDARAFLEGLHEDQEELERFGTPEDEEPPDDGEFYA